MSKLPATKKTKKVMCQGGCHCGGVRFQVIIDSWKILKCNCSVCRKKGFLHLIVPPENFRLIKGQDLLSTYTFNTGVAKHNFCRNCGIHSFYTPRSHPDCIDVNVRCLDRDLEAEFEIVPFDGANWETNASKIQDNC